MQNVIVISMRDALRAQEMVRDVRHCYGYMEWEYSNVLSVEDADDAEELMMMLGEAGVEMEVRHD